MFRILVAIDSMMVKLRIILLEALAGTGPIGKDLDLCPGIVALLMQAGDSLGMLVQPSSIFDLLWTI